VAANDISNLVPLLIAHKINKGVMLYNLAGYIREYSGWDGIRIRLDVTGSGILGLDGSADFVFNFNSRELTVLGNANVTVGLQAGASGAAGIWLGFNAPTNTDYLSRIVQREIGSKRKACSP
jgi:hypothetical protein